MIASSSSSPAMRIDSLATMPPSEMTATSVVPPPMSTIMLPGRLVHRQPGADRGGHRLLDDVRRLARAGLLGRLLHRALLDAGDAGRHADHHARPRPLARVHALDEVAQHLLADVEVGDHAVLQRADRLDVLGRAPDHLLRFDADRERTTVAHVDRDHRRLVEHDAAPAHVHERVGSAEVDRHVAAEQSGVEGFAHVRDSLPPTRGHARRLARAAQATSRTGGAPF